MNTHKLKVHFPEIYPISATLLSTKQFLSSLKQKSDSTSVHFFVLLTEEGGMVQGQISVVLFPILGVNQEK